MELSEIKSRLSMQAIMEHYGLRADKNHRVLCPFHDDKTPSLQVYPETNTCYCFSSNCKTHGRSMDVIDFIMYREGLDKHGALLRAATLVGEGGLEILPAATRAIPAEESINPIRDREKQAARSAYLSGMFGLFRSGIGHSEGACAYLSGRGLDYRKTEVGYHNGTFHTGKHRELTAQGVEYGLLSPIDKREGSYNIFARYCIVFPLKDREGNIVSFYFRSIVNNDSQRHFYLRDRRGLYPGYPGEETVRLLLTESVIDCASWLQRTGKPAEEDRTEGALACYGTNGLTGEHLEAIRSLRLLEEIVFFFDGDQAGRSAVKKYETVIRRECPGVSVSMINTPEGEDVNSLIQGHEGGILQYLYERRVFLFSTEKKLPESEKEVPAPETAAKSSSACGPGSESRFNTSNPGNPEYYGGVADYYVKGFRGEQSDSLKVTLQTRIGEKFYSSKLDLYEHKQVESYGKSAGERLGVDGELIEGDIYKLSRLLEDYTGEYRENTERREPRKVEVPAGMISRCMNFLRQEKLIERINGLIGQAGIVGEETNRILLFTIACSYRMPTPLHGLIQGSSGSGKTQLLKVISSLMPPEDVKSYTRVTDNSFYNQGEYFFVNKLLCFEDLDGLKEEAQLAVRELQSNEILITSTSIKDAGGAIRGGERIVRGPIASLACTTRGEVYEDNVSRSFLVAVDESRTQTARVIEYQNRLSAGLIDPGEQKKIREFLQNCMRLLKPCQVVNPYAHRITLPPQAHKIRRLNELYQSFVRQITLINQYRRKKDAQGRLVSEKEDLETACGILFESIVLKVDELDGSLRQFFEKLKDYVEKKSSREKTEKSRTEFNRFEVREATGVSKTQQHYYIQKLVELEYLQQNGYANRGFRYRIAYWDNLTLLRGKIREELENQLQSL